MLHEKTSAFRTLLSSEGVPIPTAKSSYTCIFCTRDGVLVIGDGRCFPEEEGLNDTCLDVAKVCDLIF